MTRNRPTRPIPKVNRGRTSREEGFPRSRAVDQSFEGSETEVEKHARDHEVERGDHPGHRPDGPGFGAGFSGISWNGYLNTANFARATSAVPPSS